MNCRRLLLGMLAWVLMLPAPQDCDAQNRIDFSLQNRRAEQGMYFAELWADIAAGKTWIIQSSNIGVQFDSSALAPFDAEPAYEIDQEFSDLFYLTSQTSNLTEVRLNLLKFGTPFASKTGSFRIATFRWTIKDGTKNDNLQFATSVSTVIFHDISRLNYNTGDSTGFGVTNPAAQKIDSLAVLTQPVSQEICIGSSANFSVNATGATLSYQWQHDDGSGFSDIAGANSSMLAIASVQNGDAGSYRAHISSASLTLFSSTAVLTVNSPPGVLQQPSDSFVCEGQSASFTVQASGQPAPDLQWQRSSDNGGSWADIALATASTLTVSNAGSSLDGNRYRVHLSNSCGNTLSSEAVLHVSSLATFTIQPAATAATVGQQAVFSASATGGPLSYQWQCDKGAGFSAITGATGAQLVIEAVQLSDAGSYRLVVSNACSQADTSETVQLDVFEFSNFGATVYLGGYWNGIRHRRAAALLELYDGPVLATAVRVSDHSVLVDSSGSIDAQLRGVRPGWYWLVLRHGGHLGVASAARVRFQPGVAVQQDFSNPAAVFNGTDALETVTLNGQPFSVLKSGDLDGDRTVSASDFLLYLLPFFGETNPGGIPDN